MRNLTPDVTIFGGVSLRGNFILLSRDRLTGEPFRLGGKFDDVRKYRGVDPSTVFDVSLGI